MLHLHPLLWKYINCKHTFQPRVLTMFSGGTRLLLAEADDCWLLLGSSSGRFLIRTSLGLSYGLDFYSSRHSFIEWENGAFFVALVQICFELLCSQGNSTAFCGELTTLPKMAHAQALAEGLFKIVQHSASCWCSQQLALVGSSIGHTSME